ncbi:MAG TPA: PQQ-dependent sugar dehydrogenase [Bacteroidia bacterium]|nr:PQQ-dependent sugar dehydrogenase [Bacteroidia bacterium]
MKKLLPLFLLLATVSVRSQTYITDTLMTGLYAPVAFDFTPDGRIFLTQKGGSGSPAYQAQVKVYTLAGNYLGIFYDLTDSTDADFERGLIGIAVDPDYTVNHYVYVYYVHNYTGDEHIRIARFTDSLNTGTHPTIIFDIDVADNLPGNHFGGNLHFRPTEPDKIYFSIGDLGLNQTDTALNYAHMLTNPFGKTLRINKDGTIPADNPYYDDGNIYTGNCDIIWSYGHRNAFDFCFSPVSDTFYCSENGLITWDEVNVIHRGRNYGWNECEGDYVNSSTTQLCDDTTSVLPIETWGAPLGGLTGILYYTGPVMPEFDDHLLVADNDYGNIFDLALGNAPAYDSVTSRTLWMDLTSTGGLTTIKEGPEGCVYAMYGGYTANGAIYRVCPSWMSVNDPSGGNMDARIYPNPSAGAATLSYRLAQPGDVKITLCDIFGKEIAVLADESENDGTHSLTIDAQQLHLPAGTYIVRIDENGFRQTLKLVIL